MNALTTLDPDTPEGRAAIRQRHDGWTLDRQRPFLEGIARGLSVEQACRLVGMSPSSAYAFRNRAAGAAFALGWRAANLVAREHIADTLLARAIHGQVETTTKPDGSTVARHRFDNRLAVTMLKRLDAQAEDSGPAHHAARLIAGDWEAYCDGLERDDGPLRAGLFLGLRAAADERDGDLTAMVQLARADRFRRTGAGLAAEVEVADLDPAQRAGWTAEQWVRAEAAGLLALAPAPPAEDDAPGSPHSPLRPTEADEQDDEEEAYIPVWEEDVDEWMTSFPPPPRFDGYEDGRPHEPDYRRELTPEEAFIVQATRGEDYGAMVQARITERDRWFAAASMRLVEPGQPFDPAALEEAAARAAAWDAADGGGDDEGDADADTAGADAADAQAVHAQADDVPGTPDLPTR